MHLRQPQNQTRPINETLDSAFSPDALVGPDHHIGCLDDGVGLLAGFELEFGHGLVGDRSGDDDAPTYVEPDMRCRGALNDLDDPALERVAR